jgi:hypothetical protein
MNQPVSPADAVKGATVTIAEIGSVIRDAQAEILTQRAEIDGLRMAVGGLLGLLKLVSCRDDLPVEIKNILATSHRVADAQLALDVVRKRHAPAAPKLEVVR